MIEGLKELGKTVFLTTHYMDEAQHLADRVAILRDGGSSPQGSTEELGEDLGRPRRWSASSLRTASAPRSSARSLGAGRIAGDEVSFETEDPQADLYRLLGWPRSGARLEDLEVRRPSLEDIFLELTSEEERE